MSNPTLSISLLGPSTMDPSQYIVSEAAMMPSGGKISQMNEPSEDGWNWERSVLARIALVVSRCLGPGCMRAMKWSHYLSGVHVPLSATVAVQQ